jgi:phosphate transport system substrate-binding protein
MIRLACLCALAMSSFASQRLYVEPFTTRAGSEKLREDLVGELHKLSSISVVSSEASADAILGGGGEIWIKGYRSLNPRAGRLPSNGTPVYGGYLSVELRNGKGETLWSYLVTPGSSSLDVSKDLAKRIAKHVAEALETIEPPVRAAAQSGPPAILKAAGATFPQPIYAKWFANYRRENPSIEITYDAVGSEAGVRRLLADAADFGASDSPEVFRQIAPSEESKYLLFPSVVGAVVPIVNLPGFTGEIAFTPEALAGIYLGKIKKWNDPLLRQANRAARLPDLDIVVIHRADGSGTSYAWTDFLSKTSPEWKAEIGTSLTPDWPAGRAANGNEGVASMVKELGGSIGYVEYIYALQKHLTQGRVRNRNGEYVEASLESIGIAVGQSVERSIVNGPGAGAYPIATFTWLVVPSQIADTAKRTAIAALLRWILGPGQMQAASLGYLALPKELVTTELARIAAIR